MTLDPIYWASITHISMAYILILCTQLGVVFPSLHAKKMEYHLIDKVEVEEKYDQN